MANAGSKNKTAQPVVETEAEKSEETQAETQRQVANRRALDELVPEVMGGASRFTREELVNATTFDDIAILVAQQQGPMVYADQELGDGYALLNQDQKKLLCGVPLILMEWAFRDGDFGRPFVSIRLAARNPDGGVSKYIINDGSTGIAEQLADYQQRTGRVGGMFVGKGLRASEYDVEVDGVSKSAVTYYLDTSKA